MHFPFPTVGKVAKFTYYIQFRTEENYAFSHGALFVRPRRAGSGTLCGFHTYVGADDMWVSCREAWVRSEPAL